MPTSLRGVSGEPIRVLSDDTRTLDAWVGTLDESQLRASGAALASCALRHNEVVNAALGTGHTPIPARFGSHFADDAECVRDISIRRAELLATLDRIAGAVESSVLIVPIRRESTRQTRIQRTEAGAGRRYLEAVRERAREAESRRMLVSVQSEQVTASVARFVREETRTLDSRGILSMTHLVSREALDAYRNTVAAIQPQEGVRIVLGEVRAPYGFAEFTATGTGHDSSSPNRND